MKPDGGRVNIIAAACCGAATLVIAVTMFTIFPASAELNRGFWSPVLAFEFAMSEADLGFLTGSGDEATRLRAAMDAGHQWDMFFPFAYGGLLAALLVQRALGRERLMWIGVPFALATIPTDIRENLVLLDITATLARGESAVPLLPALYVATWLKWGALAVAMGVLAIGLLKHGGRVRAVLGLTGSVLIALTWLTDAYAMVAEIMGLAVFAFFLAVAVVALRDAWRAFRAPT